MKHQKELAKQVNEQAQKRFQENKDEQIAKRSGLLEHSPPSYLLSLSLSDPKYQPTQPTNMYPLFQEMLMYKSFVYLWVCSPSLTMSHLPLPPYTMLPPSLPLSLSFQIVNMSQLCYLFTAFPSHSTYLPLRYISTIRYACLQQTVYFTQCMATVCREGGMYGR